MKVARKLFEEPIFAAMASLKRKLILDEDAFEKDVLENTAPCFAPLLPILRAIQVNLCKAYCNNNEEQIYQAFLVPLREGLRRAEKAEDDGTLAEVENYSVMCERALYMRRTKAFNEPPQPIPRPMGYVPSEPVSPAPDHDQRKSKRSCLGSTV